MLAGEPYDPFDPELRAARTRARDLCQELNATRETQDTERRRILCDLFGKGGDTVWMQTLNSGAGRNSGRRSTSVRTYGWAGAQSSWPA